MSILTSVLSNSHYSCTCSYEESVEKELQNKSFASDDEKVGYKILLTALDIPLKLIAQNAGAKGDVVVETVRKEAGAYGFDALTIQYGDMFKAGIVDPAKVTLSALQNAASVGSMLLTTEAAVVEIPEEKPEAPAMPPGMGGMGY